MELAVYADAVAGEVAAVSARVERLRSQLRQAAIERAARRALPDDAVARLEQAGVLRVVDERSVRAELAELQETLAALAQLQAWVEAQLVAAEAA